MIRLIRIVGFLLIGCGAIVAATWLIKPLRFVWPWLQKLPLAIQIGFGVAAVGFVILLASMIWERIEDREKDKDLLDEP